MTAKTDPKKFEFIDPGNGLQFVKIGSLIFVHSTTFTDCLLNLIYSTGTEVLRLSKALELGAVMKYGYGWVDFDTPSYTPLQYVVGTVRDPLMMVFLLYLSCFALELL